MDLRVSGKEVGNFVVSVPTKQKYFFLSVISYYYAITLCDDYAITI